MKLSVETALEMLRKMDPQCRWPDFEDIFELARDTRRVINCLGALGALSAESFEACIVEALWAAFDRGAEPVTESEVVRAAATVKRLMPAVELDAARMRFVETLKKLVAQEGVTVIQEELRGYVRVTLVCWRCSTRKQSYPSTQPQLDQVLGPIKDWFLLEHYRCVEGT